MPEIRFEFDDENHIYHLKDTGEEVPGCTRVIDTGGGDEYKNVREDILERKSAIGREVHRATLLYDRGVLDWKTLDPRVEGYVLGWKYFREATSFVPILNEHRSVCEVYGRKFGLTIDCSGFTRLRNRRSPGDDTIVEKKSTVAKSRRHELQTAGYALGLPKKGISSALARFLSRRRLITYLKPKGDPDIHECKNKGDYEVFMSLLVVTHWRLHELHRRIERELEYA